MASFLADAVLYRIDKAISNLNVYYVRYSDDILSIGNDWKDAYVLLKVMLDDMDMKLNPKK